MKEYDGFTEVKIRNPWDTAKLLKSYILLEKGKPVPEGFNGAEVIRVPLEKSIVYSEVHSSLLQELGKGDAVSGVCDTEYLYQPWLKERLRNSETVDCGQSGSPNVEMILKLSPGAVLLSPYENTNGHGKLDMAGIPIVECADYMETTPLGRAEWMKFYGRLYGVKEKTDSLYDETEKEYNRLKSLAENTTSRPKVIFDRIYGQTWSVPGGRSTIGTLIKDAGGSNPFGKEDVTGSLSLSPERVLIDAGDADVWLIRYTDTPLTLSSLGADKPLYSKFKAFKDGNVYGSDTSRSHIFEEAAFHPQWLLSDLMSIFHPELGQGTEYKHYFTKLEK